MCENETTFFKMNRISFEITNCDEFVIGSKQNDPKYIPIAFIHTNDALFNLKSKKSGELAHRGASTLHGQDGGSMHVSNFSMCAFFKKLNFHSIRIQIRFLLYFLRMISFMKLLSRSLE